MLHADHRVSSLDYDALLKATQILTKDATEVERAFRLACFNVLTRNRDDHVKNVSFLLDDATNQWTLAPAYDLTFSSGPGGEQSMTVMGEGREPNAGHLSALAKKHDLKHGAAIIGEVQAAVADWSKHADAAGLTKKAAKLIGDRIAPPSAKVVSPKAKHEPKPKAKPKAKGAAAGKTTEPEAKSRKASR